MTDQPDPADRPPPQEWLDVLAESEVDLAAGRTVDGAAVRRRLRETIAEMEAGAPAGPARKAVHRR